MNARTFRLIALLGLGLVLIVDLARAFPLQPRQGWGFLVLALAVIGVLLSARVLMPEATAALRRNKDLLVPVGLLFFAQNLVGWLTLLPFVGPVLAGGVPLALGTLPLPLSLSFLLNVAVNVLYAAWATTAVLGIARTGQVEIVAAFRGSWRWCFRVLGLTGIGWAVMYGGLAVGIALMPVALPLAWVFLGALMLVWNFATAALLLVGLQTEGGFWRAFHAGLRASWRHKWKWWRPLVAQFLLLGLFTVFRVRWSDAPGSYQESTNWSLNTFWVGGYQEECHWYGKLMDALGKTPTVGLLLTLLGLVFAVFAVLIKLHVAQRLRSAGTPLPGVERPPAPDEPVA
jgi:hypothetical protein